MAPIDQDPAVTALERAQGFGMPRPKVPTVSLSATDMAKLDAIRRRQAAFGEAQTSPDQFALELAQGMHAPPRPPMTADQVRATEAVMLQRHGMA